MLNGSSLRQTTGGIATVRTYDAHQRMQSQSTAGGLQAQFSDHPDGIRSGRTLDGQLTSSVQDGTGLGKVLQSTTNGQTTSHVPRLAHEDPSQASESERWAYQHDDRGSHRSQSDAGANARGKQAYDAWGALQSQCGLPNSDFGWATEQRDPTGLIYLRARYYDPSIGRFLARDPILGDLTDPQSWNRYSYAGNDPVNGSDPSGLKPDGNDKKKKLRACRNPGQYTGSCKGGPPNKKYIINEWDEKNIRRAREEREAAEREAKSVEPAKPAEPTNLPAQAAQRDGDNGGPDLLHEGETSSSNPVGLFPAIDLIIWIAQSAQSVGRVVSPSFGYLVPPTSLNAPRPAPPLQDREGKVPQGRGASGSGQQTYPGPGGTTITYIWDENTESWTSVVVQKPPFEKIPVDISPRPIPGEQFKPDETTAGRATDLVQTLAEALSQLLKLLP